jgi:two-component system chemotaxis sensor kinase CheA
MSGNEEFIQEFLVECEENLDQLDQDLVALEKTPNDPQRLASIFRTIHTIKGTSGFFGFAKLGALAHAGENLLGRMRDGVLTLTPDIATGLLELVDAIRKILDAIARTGKEGDGNYGSLSTNLEALCIPSNPRIPGKPSAPVARTAPRQGVAAAPPESRTPVAPPAPSIAAPKTELEREPVNTAEPEPVVADAIEPLASEAPHVEAPDDEAPEPEAPEPEAPEVDLELAPAVPQPSDVAASDAGASSEGGEPAPAGSEGSVRVDVALLNQLMNQVGELVLARNQIRPFAEAIPDRVFMNAAQQLDHITSELQEGIMKTRMQPIGGLWSRLPRVVRDLARSRGKQVQLEMFGRETELDRTLLEAIKDPLTHLVRNAVDHGIEEPAVRLQRGKPEVGQVMLRAYHEGGMVNIEITDDGAGIDTERVRDKALRMGLITPDQARGMADQQVKQLIFSPGLSTAQRVTDVSGRGVGMDVVKTNIERIGGAVSIESRLGQGTTLRVKIPLTLAIIPALIVESHAQRFAIPQVSLREIVTVQSGSADEIETIGTVPVYRLRGELLPLVVLTDVLQMSQPAAAARQSAQILVLQAVGHRFGLIVERVRNTEEIVVKPLHKLLNRLAVYSGATIMGDGRVALILDVVGLARRAAVVDAEQTELSPNEVDPNESEEDDSEYDGANEYLLCAVGGDDQIAVPLVDVARLEEIPHVSIQRSTGQPVIPYRRRIMPLLSLDRTGQVTPRPHGGVPVVVHNVGSRCVGLMVEQIVDIAMAAEPLDTSQQQTAIRGRILIDGRVVDVVDIRELARACGVQLAAATEAKR